MIGNQVPTHVMETHTSEYKLKIIEKNGNNVSLQEINVAGDKFKLNFKINDKSEPNRERKRYR
jgi:hypothetical protein